MSTTSILINHKTGKLKAYWEQKDEIEKASDEDPMLPNVHYLIKVSDDMAIAAIKGILHGPDDIPEGCVIGDDGEIWRTYKI